MNVHETQTACESGTAHDTAESTTNRLPPGQSLGVSTRILLDSGSVPECHACGSSIEYGTAHKCLTVRDSNATVQDLLFCSQGCLADADSRYE